jgi:hypothetical protein
MALFVVSIFSPLATWTEGPEEVLRMSRQCGSAAASR